jgi:O-antigen ligase
VPGLSQDASEREGEDAPVWVRINTANAALSAVEQNPLMGLGWGRFEELGGDYFHQSGDTPLEGLGEGVHNVLLARASELGVIGAFLWLAALLLAVGGAIVRRGPPELLPWRVGLLALAVHWAVVAAATPLPYAFPTLLLFAWAGITRAGAPASRWVRVHERGPRPAMLRA